jgi:hypothetical protein
MGRWGWAAGALLATAVATAGTPPVAPLPKTLADTGLFEPGGKQVRAANAPFSPRYPLWSDGTTKRRWISLPPGTAIDKSDPDAWAFPSGTRIWKEFGYGRPVETRFIERLADGSWRFAAYAWNASGTEATLAPEGGITLRVEEAPGGTYSIPSRLDCIACHEGPRVPVLGYSAVQQSRSLESAAANAAEHAALGYLHGNCGHCHNDNALGGVGLSLAQEASRPHESRARAVASVRPRIAQLKRRLHATNPMTRMPPLGTRVADAEGIALVERWIHELSTPQEK